MSDSSALAARLKTKIIAANIPTQSSLMTLAVGVVAVGALYVAREVLIPITLAILLSFVLMPMVSRLRRMGLWRVPSVFLAVFLALGVILALGAVIGTQLAQLGGNATMYAQRIEDKIGTARGFVARETATVIGRLGRTIEQPKPSASPTPRGRQPAEVAPVVVEVRQPDATPFEMLERIATPILGPLASLGIVLVVAVFIMLQMEDLRDRMIRLFGSRDLHRMTTALDDAGGRLSRYFLTQLALNAGFGVVIAAGLFVLGVPSPALFGIIAALFRFVPYIGAVAAALLPAALAAAVDPGWALVIETLAMFAIVEMIAGQVIEPLAYGHSTGLSPVSVVVSAIFWAWLWGPVGLILAMPLTLCLVVLGRHVEHLQFIDVLLGDQPALTPAESFYQRVLAGDADEALDQAEILLRDRSLSAYYDEVALKGLQMAANDSIRGVLTEAQLDNIREGIGAVMLDLAHHADVDAEADILPGPHAGVVLCVAGRGLLDEAASAMLAQVLTRRGLHARVASSAAVSRGTIDALDVTGVDVVCLSYLESAGSMSGLRYLMRRIHQRAPGVPTLVGLWQADRSLLDEERLKAVVGADYYTTSLRDAVAECVSRARLAEPVASAPSAEPDLDLVLNAGAESVSGVPPPAAVPA